MFNPTLDYEIEQLVQLAESELKDKSEKWRKDCWKLTHAVFEQWKFAHGNRNPTIQSGLLGGGLLGGAVLGTGTPIDFKDATPVQCADIWVSNYIDLCFKLWVENYELFIELLEKVGLEKIFSLVVVHEAGTASAGSIVRAVTLIVNIKISNYEFLISLYRRKLSEHIPKINKIEENLKAGRAKGTIENQRRAEELHRQWKLFAVNLLKRFPNRSEDEVAGEIRQNRIGKMKSGKLYSKATIKKIIAGSKKKALELISQQST